MTRYDPRVLRERARSAEEAAIHEIEQRGSLRHLHGHKLDLSDSSPEWFSHELLKREGYTHPLLERGREVDEVRDEANDVADDLRRARNRLATNERGYTRDQAQGFNARRSHDLQTYRHRLARLNRAILFYNLGVPERLHRFAVNIDRAVDTLATEVPPLDDPVEILEVGLPRWHFTRRILRRVRRSKG
jgi:hypothetical protein